jgi:hypothetical protein
MSKRWGFDERLKMVERGVPSDRSAEISRVNRGRPTAPRFFHPLSERTPSPHVAVDATYYEWSPASKHYCDRTNYRVQTVESTQLVNIETRAILDVHCTTTREGSDAEVCAQLACRYAGELQNPCRRQGL